MGTPLQVVKGNTAASSGTAWDVSSGGSGQQHVRFGELLAEVESSGGGTGEVLRELQEMGTFRQFLSDQCEDVKGGLRESEGRVGELQGRNADLSGRVRRLQRRTGQLTHQVGLLERCSRGDCLEFRGVECRGGGSTDSLVIQCAGRTGITISEKDISISHRLAPVDPSSNNKVPNIIANSQAAK